MSELQVENVQIRERFEVDNDMKAEWCLSKIRKIRQEQQRESEELIRQMKFYLEQKEMIDTKADEDVAFFESLLLPYFRQRVDDGFVKATKTKVTYKLPTGELVMKHQEPEYDYKTKQDEAIAFCKANKLEKFVRAKEELKWNDLKKLTQVSGESVVLVETGEVIPGIKVTEREDEFKVEVK